MMIVMSSRDSISFIVCVCATPFVKAECLFSNLLATQVQDQAPRVYQLVLQSDGLKATQELIGVACSL